MIYDVAVIGAGQAGLATGYYLKQNNLKYIILEAADQAGTSLDNRYDRLILFSPNRFNSLPGSEFPGPPDEMPSSKTFSAYLKQYVQQQQIQVRFNSRIEKLSFRHDCFNLSGPSVNILARQVVVATGPHNVPNFPTFYRSGDLFEIHSGAYRNPDQITGSKVLIIGSANSAADLAVDLAETHQVALSARSKLRFSGLHFLSRHVIWWSYKTGLVYARTNSLIGKLYRKIGEPIFRKHLKNALYEGKVRVVPEVKSLTGSTVTFTDNQTEQFDAIIYATGFRSDYSWVDIPSAFNDKGQPIHKRGVSGFPNLYFMGMEWQTSRSSALILGADHDANFITGKILEQRKSFT
jgi:putative flavoprotein involved in K+ transport